MQRRGEHCSVGSGFCQPVLVIFDDGEAESMPGRWDEAESTRMYAANCKCANLIGIELNFKMVGKKIEMDGITQCCQDLSAGAGCQSLQGTGVESPHRVTSTSVGRFVSLFLCVEILCLQFGA